MATYLQFSGFHESVPNTTSKSAGLMIFSTWDFNAQEYLQSDTVTINTPGVPNIEGIAVDAQPAGCFINGVTTLPNGFGFGVGDQNTNDPIKADMVRIGGNIQPFWGALIFSTKLLLMRNQVNYQPVKVTILLYYQQQ